MRRFPQDSLPAVLMALSAAALLAFACKSTGKKGIEAPKATTPGPGTLGSPAPSTFPPYPQSTFPPSPPTTTEPPLGGEMSPAPGPASPTGPTGTEPPESDGATEGESPAPAPVPAQSTAPAAAPSAGGLGNLPSLISGGSGETQPPSGGAPGGFAATLMNVVSGLPGGGILSGILGQLLQMKPPSNNNPPSVSPSGPSPHGPSPASTSPSPNPSPSPSPSSTSPHAPTPTPHNPADI